jgi:hypothetical protein
MWEMDDRRDGQMRQAPEQNDPRVGRNGLPEQRSQRGGHSFFRLGEWLSW